MKLGITYKGRTKFEGAEELMGDWRKLHNEGLCDLCSLSNIWVIKSRVRWGREACSTYG